MNRFGPDKRRFGRGVARLAIGHPRPDARLSALARRPARFESVAIATPPGVAAVFALVIAFALEPHTADEIDRLARAPETWIDVRDWHATPPPLESRDPAPPELAARPTPPRATETTFASTDASTPPTEDVVVEAPTRPSLALAALTLPAPSVPETTDGPAVTRIAAARRDRRPGGLPTAPALTDLPLALPASTQPPAPEALAASARAIASPSRGDRRRALGAAAEPAPSPGWTVEAERRAFLADAALAAQTPRASGRRTNGLPAVSAPELRARADAVRAAWAADGWREVPLDALPDCSPPGRQDALKREILARVPSGSTCTGPRGAYRFLETRNLNAFLMWSRTNPTDRASSAGAEDACRVLEHALDCLSRAATKELDPR